MDLETKAAFLAVAKAGLNLHRRLHTLEANIASRNPTEEGMHRLQADGDEFVSAFQELLDHINPVAKNG